MYIAWNKYDGDGLSNDNIKSLGLLVEDRLYGIRFTMSISAIVPYTTEAPPKAATTTTTTTTETTSTTTSTSTTSTTSTNYHY